MKTILHMPHISTEVPDEFYDGLLIDKNLFNKYNLEMADLCIDELFKEYDYEIISPKYSRMYCDVERFRDDGREIMAGLGMGVIYTHTYDGIRFHSNTPEYRAKVLEYYDEYHRKFDEIAERLLSEDDTLLIIDCHSYSEKVASKFTGGPYPDVCIGVEDDYCDLDILHKIVDKVTSMGYSFLINHPYKGSFVPNCVTEGRVKGNVISIMVEINKKIYL